MGEMVPVNPAGSSAVASDLASARSSWRIGLVLVAAAGISSLIAIVVNEYAVRAAGGQMSYLSSYAVGLAALLAFLAALLGIRAYRGADRSGGAVLLAVLAAVVALLAGVFIFFSPTMVNLSLQCMDPGAMECPEGTPISEQSFPLFYVAAVAAAAGGVLAIASVVFLSRGRVQVSQT